MKITFAFSIFICMLLSCKNLNAQRTNSRAPLPGIYNSSTTSSWLTVIPKSNANPGKTYSSPVSYGVGSTSFKGLFGDLILRANGEYSLTKDTHGGTWEYDAAKDSVIFTGWLSTFKTRYFNDSKWIIIYTGDVKMPDGKTLNITYTKSTAKKEN